MSAYRGSSESSAASTLKLLVSLSSASVMREDSVVLNLHFAVGFLSFSGTLLELCFPHIEVVTF